MDADNFFETDDVSTEIDTEVKRVSDLFRFMLKYKRQFQASGIEFSDLREYMVTDDASRIDWKNSASTQDLYVKEYEEEKDMDTFVILDVSDTMLFGTAEKIKAEYAAIIGAALAYASIDAGINVGFGMFGDDKMTITPNGGQAQYQKVLNEIAKFDNYGGTFNLEDALETTLGNIKENTAVFVISDFLEVEGDWKSKMQVSSMKFRHVLTIMTRDLRDYKLPESGNFRFEHPGTGEQLVANTDKIREEYEKEAKKREGKIHDMVSGAGAGMIKVDTRDSFSAKFAQYYDEKGEQW